MDKSPDFINWTVYRMTYNDKDAYKRRKIVLQHIREHASVFRWGILWKLDVGVREFRGLNFAYFIKINEINKYI